MSVSEVATFANQTPQRIGAVRLSVRDCATVAAYYRDVLGLLPMSGSDGAVGLGAGGVTLIELEHRPDALPDDPRSAGLFHTAFLMPERADLARWMRRFRDLGLPIDGASDHLVSEAIYLSDPEGNGIEVYADRPRDAWQWGADGLHMGTYPLDMADLLAADREGRPYVQAPAGLRVGHIHLRVGDLDRAEAFYCGLLGMAVTVRVPGATFLSSGGYHHHVGANVWRSQGAGSRDARRAGLAQVEIEATSEELEGIRRRLAAEGMTAEPRGRHLALTDPWGTRVAIREIEEW